MSHQSVVRPDELSAQKAELAHVPISGVQPTQTGGIHLGSGPKHAAKERELVAARVDQQAAGSGQSYCDWAQWQVNPDVVPMNAPTLLSVKYRGKETTLGSILLKKDTQTQPELDWALATPKMAVAGMPQLFSVIMCDPDAPSRAHPKFRHYLHWLCVNVPGPYNLEQGHVLAPYVGPSPPPNTGLHRYCFLVYAQTGVIEADAIHVYKNDQRPGWSLVKFLADHKYAIDGSTPIAGSMFRCQNEHQTAHSEEPALQDQMPMTKKETAAAEKADVDAAEKHAKKK